MSEQEELSNSRKQIFRTLVRRMRTLYHSRPIPESFYVGQDYIECPTNTQCEILISFMFPATIKATTFWYRKSEVSIETNPPYLNVRIKRALPQRLWDDLKFLRRGQNFIIGYANGIMPKVNRALLDNRYYHGHPLSRTFSLLDAVALFVLSNGQLVQLSWPPTMPPFPPSDFLAGKRNEVFLRDYVDAMHAYFKNDFDDCIRRIITSTENLFWERGWTKTSTPWLHRKLKIFWAFVRGKRWGERNSFRRILYGKVEQNSLAGQVVSQNLDFIYGLRNKIVHSGFRMSTASGLFCDKSIATLKYLIYRYGGDMEISKYVHQLGMQFLMLQGVLGNNFDLDVIAKRNKKLTESGPPISSARDFDEFMFSSLRFTTTDKSSIH